MWRNDNIAKTSDNAPVKNNMTRVAADRGKVNAKNSSANPLISK
jgi:hypothetical protein